MRNFQPSKETALQKMNFINFFSLWVIRNPDPDCESESGSGPRGPIEAGIHKSSWSASLE
jgi:hypothetical protein